MKIHKAITPERVMEACERHRMTLDNPGFCIECGMECDGVEPDARRYPCESCGARGVFGAEDLLIRMF
jgi:hypothetical protein